MAGSIKQPPASNEVLFKQFYPEIKVLVAKRRASWVLSSEPWEDVSSKLTTHVWQKIHLYDPKRPFDRWCNTLISHRIINILRDNLYKHAKPCISAGPAGGRCVYNKGEDQCAWTKSGLQCAQCPIFAAWQKKKESKHNINATLSLEHHTDEVHARPHDWVNTDEVKKVIDVKIIPFLSKDEAVVYRLLYIRNWPMKKVGKKMGYKIQGAETKKSIPGYQRLIKMVAKFRQISRQIIEEENLT